MTTQVNQLWMRSMLSLRHYVARLDWIRRLLVASYANSCTCSPHHTRMDLMSSGYHILAFSHFGELNTSRTAHSCTINKRYIGGASCPMSGFHYTDQSPRVRQTQSLNILFSRCTCAVQTTRTDYS